MLGLEPCVHLEEHKAGSDLAHRSEFDSSGEWGSQHQRAIASHPSSLALGWCRQVGTASDGLMVCDQALKSVNSSNHVSDPVAIIVFHHDRHPVR